MIRLRQVSEDFIDKKTYYKYYLKTLEFKISVLVLLGGYFSILGTVLYFVDARGKISSESTTLTIFFISLLLIVLFMLFGSPVLFLRNAWNKYFIFELEYLKCITEGTPKEEEISYKNIYGLYFTESLKSVNIFYYTNNFRYNKVIGLSGVKYDDFIKIADLIKAVRNDVNIVKRKNSYF